VCPIHNPAGIVEVGATDVPSVIGMDLGAATSTLQALGFFVTIAWDDGGGLPQGTVFGQSPSPGFPAQLNSDIELTLAGPAFDAALPSVLGFTIEEAHSRMDPIGVGINVIIEAEANPDDAQRRPGVIWKQDPANGGAVEGTVTVWINP
jgi:beta-lactam-binding protein with PASTA domain